MADAPIPDAVVRGGVPPFHHVPHSALPPGVTVIRTYRLYSPGQVGLATLLAGPLVGGILLARNFYRFDERRRAWTALIVSFVITLALIAIGASERAPNYLALGPFGLMIWYAEATQGAKFKQHLERGGLRASHWHVVGIAIATVVVLLGTVFGVLLAYDYLTRNVVEVPPHGEVMYRDGATESEARAVARALSAVDYFPADSEALVVVSHDGDRVVVGLVVAEGTVVDHDIEQWAQGYAEPLSKRAFAGRPVDIEVLDGELRALAHLPWATRPQTISLGEKRTVSNGEGATGDDARAVGNVLLDHKFFGPDGVGDVEVTRSGRPVVRFVMQDWTFEDNAFKQIFHARWAPVLSRGAFRGVPVDVWLVNDEQVPRVKLTWETRPPEPIVVGDDLSVYAIDGSDVDLPTLARIATEQRELGERWVASHPTTGRALVEVIANDALVKRATAIGNPYERVAQQLSTAAFGGGPVDMRIVGDKYTVDILWESHRKR